jgi:hypothetical protein
LTGTVFFPIGGGSLASATEASVAQKINPVTTFSKFGATLSAALGTGNSVVLTWRTGGADQALTCTIADPAVTCSDTTHSFSNAAADLMSVKAAFTGTIVVAPIFTFTTLAGVTVSGPTGPTGPTGPAGGAGSYVLVEQHTASTSATLDFTTCITSTYDDYQLRFLNILPATNAAGVLMRFSVDGGATYDAGSNYTYVNRNFFSGGSNDDSGAAQSAFSLGGSISNTGYGFSATLNISNPLGGTSSTAMYGQNLNKNTGVGLIGNVNFDIYVPTTAVNAFRVLASSGNITSGTVRCYGIAK